jgi:8-oxo-dGTP pyrophosphatase MutT (NUDIX family)
MGQSDLPPCFYRVSAKALILNAEKKFLLFQEENGIYDLPWWGVDWGESPQTCIARELQEEAWLTVRHIASHPSYFFTVRHLKKNFRIANPIYETTIEESALTHFTPSSAAINYGFFTKEEAEKLQIYPNIQEFLKIFNPNNH